LLRVRQHTAPASTSHAGKLKTFQAALGISEDEVAEIIDVIKGGGSLAEALGEPLERLFAEVMVLVSAVDGHLKEAEARALVESFASDPLFHNVSPERAQAFVSEAVTALVADGLPQRLQVLAHGLTTHTQRLRAYRLATKAWVDRASVAGYLLPVAYLKARGLEPAKTFASQQFVGSYRVALEAVKIGTADVASIFCPPESTGLTYVAGVEVVLPGKGDAFEPIAYTEEAPNDGVPVAMGVPAALVSTLEETLLGLQGTPEGQELLKGVFSADRFEPAPRMGYRALYRVALASL
jgi:phosphonate transport system substrate-binding protein